MIEELLATSIACQKRTGRAKKFTFYTPEGKILKGPYDFGSPRSLLDKIHQRYESLVRWKTPLITPPEDYLETEEGVWIVYPNLGNPPFVECTSQMNKESFSDYSYRVLDRTNLIKMSDALLKDSSLVRYATPIVTASIHLLLAGVGDRGLYNVLYNKTTQEVHVIDIDEDNHQLRDSPYWYFSKDPSSKYAQAWNDAIDWEQVRNSLNCLDGVDLTQVLERIPKREEKREALFRGIFSSITRSGYGTDVLKSALQKWIRRGETLKALMASFDLYDLGLIGKPIMTNLWNRISIIAAEDIGPANPDLALAIISNERREPTYLGAIVQLMSQSSKTRVLSHLWRTYATPEGMAMGRELGIKEDRLGTGSPVEWRERDPEELKPIVEMFSLRLKERDDRVFYWLGQFLERCQGMKVHPRNRRTKPEAIIWQLLTKNRSYLLPLVKAYFDHKENRPFLTLGVLLAMSGEGRALSLDSYASEWRDYVQPFLIGEYELVVDDYCIDKHTKKGRSQGKGRGDFVREGAKIVNESSRFIGGNYDIYKRIYENS